MHDVDKQHWFVQKVVKSVHTVFQWCIALIQVSNVTTFERSMEASHRFLWLTPANPLIVKILYKLIEFGAVGSYHTHTSLIITQLDPLKMV